MGMHSEVWHRSSKRHFGGRFLFWLPVTQPWPSVSTGAQWSTLLSEWNRRPAGRQLFRSHNAESRMEHPAFAKQRRFGGGDRDRTGDLLIANEALSQLSYSPSWVWITAKFEMYWEVVRADHSNHGRAFTCPAFRVSRYLTPKLHRAPEPSEEKRLPRSISRCGLNVSAGAPSGRRRKSMATVFVSRASGIFAPSCLSLFKIRTDSS